MSDPLKLMFETQRDLQAKAYGRDPGEITEPEERIQFIKDMHLALSDEMHEFLGEAGWKPWAKSRHINEDLAKGELVDAFHFFMNLCMAVHLEPEELFTLYMEKQNRNRQRQAEGYDGVTGKCESCGRALDDIAHKQGITVDQVWVYSGGRITCIVCIEDSAEARAEEAGL